MTTKVYIWPTKSGSHYCWATEHPLPHDDDPSAPGTGNCLQHAYDEVMTFVNGPFYPIFNEVAPRFKEPPPVKKYRVNFEASAAIGVEIKVAACTPGEAQKAARNLIIGGLNLKAVVYDLVVPNVHAVKGYADQSRHPITHVAVSLDEAGFEIVDVFEPTADQIQEDENDA